MYFAALISVQTPKNARKHEKWKNKLCSRRNWSHNLIHHASRGLSGVKTTGSHVIRLCCFRSNGRNQIQQNECTFRVSFRQIVYSICIKIALNNSDQSARNAELSCCYNTQMLHIGLKKLRKNKTDEIKQCICLLVYVCVFMHAALKLRYTHNLRGEKNATHSHAFSDGADPSCVFGWNILICESASQVKAQHPSSGNRMDVNVCH